MELTFCEADKLFPIARNGPTKCGWTKAETMRFREKWRDLDGFMAKHEGKPYTRVPEFNDDYLYPH